MINPSLYILSVTVYLYTYPISNTSWLVVTVVLSLMLLFDTYTHTHTQTNTHTRTCVLPYTRRDISYYNCHHVHSHNALLDLHPFKCNISIDTDVLLLSPLQLYVAGES